MKKYSILLLFAAIFFTACDPSEDNKSLGTLLSKSDLKVSFTQIDKKGSGAVATDGGNYMVVSNSTPGTLAMWDAIQGKSYKNNDTIFTPFMGTYNLICAVYTGGGVVKDTLKYTVKQMSPDIEKEPRYKKIAGNDYQGKKWVLDMSQNMPMGFFGTTYPIGSDNWSWIPDITGNSWIGMSPDVNYGDITFDMKGNYNVLVHRLDPNTKKMLTESGTFSIDFSGSSITFNGGEFPNIPAQYSVIGTWAKAKILNLTDNQLIIGFYRPGDPAYIGLIYKPAAN